MTFYKPGFLLFLTAPLVLIWAPAIRANSQTQAVDLKYKQKFAEVLQPGLVVGNCSDVMIGGINFGSDASIVVAIGENDTKLHNKFGCATQQLYKGEALFVEKVRIADHGRIIWLQAHTLAPHSWTRGIGAFEHESHEIGRVMFVFKSDNDPNSLISKWLQISTAVSPDKLGNTASMVQVKQVKLGMSSAEVEDALGLPITRIDLAAETLYKYKDMTIEFQDGKVTDVR